MKIFVLLLSILSSSMSFGDTSVVREIIVDGLRDQIDLKLSTEKTKIEYRSEQVRTTCYRTEYRRRCYNQPRQCRQVCRDGRCRQVCRPGRQVCRQEPYRFPYSCIRTVRRAYEVLDYYVDTSVKFVINTQDALGDTSEKLKLKVKGDDAKLTVKGSGNYFIVLDKKSEKEEFDLDTKYIDIVYKINLVPAGKVKSALGSGIKNVKLNKGVLKFSLGAGFNLTDFTQKLRVYRYKRFGKDKLIKTKMLTNEDVLIEVDESKTVLTYDLNDLNIKIPSKVKIRLNSEFKIENEKVLNKDQIETEAKVGWIFK